MSKSIVNNRINSSNIYGRTIQHDIYLNQGVRSGDSPTFNNLLLTGNATISGNLYVEGNTSLLDTNTVQFKDNIILINDKETNAGVTLNLSGLEIDRGTLTNFRFVYNEMNKRAEVGFINNLQPISLRESNPLNYGIMTWNSISNLITSSNIINIPITFGGTINSTSSSTGSIIIDGGIGIKKDMYIDGSIVFQQGSVRLNTSMGNLNISTVGDINLAPTNKVIIPYNIPIVFGSTNQSISVDVTGSLNINTLSSIKLNCQSINIPNQSTLVFSTVNEKIYTDNFNNMVISSSQAINFTSKKVVIPVNIPLVFNNITQSIIANSNNDLIINANNNIFLNPLLDVKIPVNSGLTFGSSGRIVSNSNNDFILTNNGNLFLNANTINIPNNIKLVFSDLVQNHSIYSDTNGNLIINANKNVNIASILSNSSTNNSVNASTGSIYTLGGLGVSKDIFCESSLHINSSNTKSISVKNNVNNLELFSINSKDSGKVNIFTGDGTPFNPSLEIISSSLTNSQSLIQLKTADDSTIGYNIGRMKRSLIINIPSYSEYSNLSDVPTFNITSNNSNLNLFSIESDTGNVNSLGIFNINNTKNSTSSTDGSIVIFGGLGITKDIYTTGIYNSKIQSTNAFTIKNQDNTILLNVDTVNENVTINQKVNVNKIDTNALSINDVFNIDTILNELSVNLNVINKNIIESTDTSTGSNILSGGMAIQKNLNVGGIAGFNNGINMFNNLIYNLKSPTNPQDAATKSYVDLVRQGLFVKDSVNVATTTSGNLNIDFVANNIIDDYTLNFGDRILIKNQINKIENGIYSITNDIPIRTFDLLNGISASGIFVFVKSGLTNISLGWICNSQSPNDIVNINVLNFTEFTGLGQVYPKNGLSKIFNEIDVNVDNLSIEIETISNSLRIKNTICSTGLTGGSGTPLQTITDQSHVTKLGIINTGTWQGSKLDVSYGGTGKTFFNPGNILFGNGFNQINDDTNFYYDNINKRLGLGTNSPASDLHINSLNTVTLLLNSDSDANNSIAKPEIVFSYNGMQNKSYIGMTRNYNEYASNIYKDSLVISNNQIDNTSIIQLATSQVNRLTILSDGSIGINTSTPNSTFDINGTLKVSGITKFTSTINSISSTMGSVILLGGVSINCSTNSTSIKNGGSLTVNGGTSINKDLYVGGSITSINSINIFSYLNIVGSNNSNNLSSGSLITSGGITIQCSIDSSSVTSGGSLLTAGGISVGKSLYVGSTIYAKSDAYLGNLYFTSNDNKSFIQSPNFSHDVSSFNPVYFTQYNNTTANILTIADAGIVLNKNKYIQIGGTLENPDGYTIYYTTGNLNIIPNSTNYNINFGTTTNYSNCNMYGINNSKISWQSYKSNLLLNNSSIQFTSNSIGSIIFKTPNSSNVSFIQSNEINMTLNFGGGGNTNGSQLTTVLSNNSGTSNITFTPSDITNSSLLITNVYTTINSPITLNDRVEYSGNSLHQTINNNNNNQLWVYFGIITGYTEIDFNNGVNNNSDVCGLKLCVAINTTCIATHSHYGNISYDSILKPICYIYNDGINFQLFVKLAGNSITNINVTSQMNTKFILLSENTNTVPSGTYSNFSNSWIKTYTTQMESTLKYTTGDLTVEGISLKINDNLPIIGYNNINTKNSRDLGLLYQRYQISNDFGIGDIVNGKFSFIDSIVNQSLISSLSQIKFSNLTSSVDNYYNGFWIKINSGNNINQTRQIINYIGSQHIAVLNAPFTSQNPSSGDTVYFYKDTYIVNYYDEINNTFSLAYTSNKSSTIISNGDANLRLKSLYSTDTTNSSSCTSGSVRLLGGLSINNTSDAISSTCGGSITTAGGISLAKNMIIGNNMGIGSNGFVPQESIHIRKTIATQRFEHDQGGYSYIDFLENSTNSRFGLLLDSSVNQFSLTNTSSSQNPLLSNKALTINNLGYVGINNTSNILSPLSINTNNFISTNSTTGFLGIIGGASNTNNNFISSRIILNTNTNTGSLNLYSGNNTSANVSIFTGNDIERVKINSNGIVKITSTQISDSNTIGSLIVSGGACISSTQNSSSFTSGGALSIAGGASVEKDLYIGGNILINGNFTATGNTKNPTINFVSFTNCSLIEYFNNTLILSGNTGVLTFGFSVYPNFSSLDTEIIFVLPNRGNSLIRRFEVISSVSGYTDETNVIPLFNILGAGIIDTTNLLVKFQSVSNAAHYIQVQCTYLLS